MIVLKARGPAGSRVLALSLWVLLAMLLVAAGLLVAGASPADAATTFTVNKTGDASDRRITDAVCDSSRNRGNQCTLRAAIEEANDTDGADTIRFNIVSNASVKTISPASALPTIEEALTINGYSQSGASPNTRAVGNNAVIKIQLNGANAGTGPDANGLVIRANDSTIKGLVINRFDSRGIVVEGFNTTGNKVEGNFVGTNAAGTAALGNGLEGVEIAGADDNTVGGTVAGAGNRIANNGAAGVSVIVNGAFGDERAAGNRVLSNSIFANTGLGIDLGATGTTANDDDDPDTGANNLQNFPVITSAIRSNTTQFTTITGTLNSDPSRSFRIQCFVAVPDPSGFGEGLIPAGEDTTVTTNSGGDASFSCASPVPQPGQAVTTTATSQRQFVGDTSEYSRNVGVVPVP